MKSIYIKLPKFAKSSPIIKKLGDFDNVKSVSIEKEILSIILDGEILTNEVFYIGVCVGALIEEQNK